ncbi:Alanine aminotransferase 1-like [Homarus americanus]|uniref:alanine transaminase n=1 Tax=Homarus americanus TaxID=6706 RepID=A0A8J5MNC0_HOMAM|nr:Alanine aminotransferase 1-like [Homarus americanus]
MSLVCGSWHGGTEPVIITYRRFLQNINKYRNPSTVQYSFFGDVKVRFDQILRPGTEMNNLHQTFLYLKVVSLCLMPSLMDDPNIPSDVKERAQGILNGCKGSSLGSYSDSAGVEVIRRHVAEYIERRDGFPSNWEDIILCAGASEGIRGTMKMMIKHDNSIKPGVMIPIPQYPLYSATIAEFDLHQIGYYLNESTNWGLDISELERAYDEAKEVSNPKALVVINPGNPTGNVLTKENIQGVIKFAYEKKLFLFADEVYQDNVYAEGCKFHSFKKVVMEMGAPYNQMELASFMSCSKECGLRGGYAEIVNLDPQVKTMYLKSISAKLCPTTLGQAVMECVVNPPREGEPSYEQFIEEKKAVLSSLAERAKMVAETFNSVPGMSCNVVQGAMYAFPQVTQSTFHPSGASSINMFVRKKATNQLSRLVEKSVHETESSSSSSEGDDKDHDMGDELFQALYETPRRNEKDSDLFKCFLGEKP